MSGRKWLVIGTCAVLAAVVAGSVIDRGAVGREPDLVWGKRGQMPGDVVRPRAVAIDGQDRLFLVDFQARIQAYDLDGTFLGASWTPPDYRNGRPSGLGIDRDGNLIVCDSHYHTVRTYSADGKELRSFGGDAGTEPGRLGYVSDCVQDADGYYYVSEFGQNDRISKFDAAGRFVTCWGENGIEPGQFQRVRSLALGPDGLLYAADACNHRIQVFTKDGKLVRVIGEPGTGPGQLSYPYDVSFSLGGELYVVERSNHRVQKFDRDGRSLGIWSGSHGAGRLADPWALAVDRFGRVHVVDTENHRVQRVKF